MIQEAFPIKIITGLVLIALMLPCMSYARDTSSSTRDIGCTETNPGRERQICEAISATLEWRWTGHATLAPGYKPTFEGIAKVVCGLRISRSDVKPLQNLIKYDPQWQFPPDWRLESAVGDILRLVANADGKGDEPVNSVFNPRNPQYILAQGCH